MYLIFKPHCIKLLFLCITLLALTNCKSEKIDPKENAQSMFDKLSNDELIEFELVADFDSLILTKKEEKYYSGFLNFKDEKDSIITNEIKIGTRGKTRKNICDFPPIRLKFPKPLLSKSKLAKYKTLKLVTPCHNKRGYDDLVMKELLCYQMFQELTGKSFRVQAAQVEIKQKNSNKSSSKMLSFIIENENEMANRLSGTLLDKSIAKVKTIDVQSYNLLALFQYMIGNTDWNLSKRHNIKLLTIEGASAPIPIPYDFDYSGLVNADYAVPHPNLPIQSVRERFFQWRGKEAKSLQPSVDILLSKKEILLNLIQNCPLKEQKTKDEMLTYVLEFFEMIESDGGLEKLVRK